MSKRWVRWVATVVGLTVSIMGATVTPATAAQTLTKAQVLIAYAPVVHLHPNESYFPMNALSYLADSALKWSHGGGCPDHTTVDAGKIDPFKLGHGGYRDRAATAGLRHFPPCPVRDPYHNSAELTRPRDSGNGLGNQPEGYFLRPNSREHGNLQTAPVYYEYVAKRSVTFWFFYGFNDAPGLGFFNHEGDWERISIQLGGDNRAKNVVFFEHDSSCVLPWSGPDPKHPAVTKYRGHPEVYVAIGTHATYPRPGEWPLVSSLPGFPKDHASASGPVWRTYQHETDVHGPWYGYGGAWGGVGVSSKSTGPLGPSRYKLGAPANFNGSPCSLKP